MREVRPGPVKKYFQSTFHAAYPTPPTVRGANTGAISAKASILLDADAISAWWSRGFALGEICAQGHESEADEGEDPKRDGAGVAEEGAGVADWLAEHRGLKEWKEKKNVNRLECREQEDASAWTAHVDVRCGF